VFVVYVRTQRETPQTDAVQKLTYHTGASVPPLPRFLETVQITICRWQTPQTQSISATLCWSCTKISRPTSDGPLVRVEDGEPGAERQWEGGGCADTDVARTAGGDDDNNDVIEDKEGEEGMLVARMAT
jgi:hypothetical protein